MIFMTTLYTAYDDKVLYSTIHENVCGNNACKLCYTNHSYSALLFCVRRHLSKYTQSNEGHCNTNEHIIPLPKHPPLPQPLLVRRSRVKSLESHRCVVCLVINIDISLLKLDISTMYFIFLYYAG